MKTKACIALVAHDNKKEDLAEGAYSNRGTL
jgi:methylglyoxal synthase